MKQRTLTILIAAITLLALSAVFLYANRLINGSLKDGYTLVYFTSDKESSQKNQANTEPINVMIANHEKAPIEYTVEFMLDDQTIETIKKSLAASKSGIVAPEPSWHEKIEKAMNNGQLYKVKVSWNNGEEIVYKKSGAKQ